MLIGKNILWLINVIDGIISSKLYDKRIEINLLNDVHENLKYNIVIMMNFIQIYDERGLFMKEKIYLSYINAADIILEGVDFNFDQQYLFSLKVDRSKPVYSYILHVSKRKGIVQPEGFWGENISNVNVIMGRNGSGKTSFMQFIINNIGSGITSMNGEGVVYIVKKDETYIVFHNCAKFEIEKENVNYINIMTLKEYDKELRNENQFKPPFDNKRFWNNMIYFSNYFGEMRLLKDDGFVINVSKDKLVDEILRKARNNDSLDFKIQEEIQTDRNIKVIHYAKEGRFLDNNLKSIISIPNLICFNLNEDFSLKKEFEEFTNVQKEYFSSKEWIGNKRYSVLSEELFYERGNVLEFEVAINTFSVRLMWTLLKEGYLEEKEFNRFIMELRDTKDKTGLNIAKECIEGKEDIIFWKELLNFLNDKEKQYVLYWQNEKRFVFKWNLEDIELIEKVVCHKNDIFFCQLRGEGKNGYYSSGEESKVNFVISLFEAIDRIEQEEKNNNNIIILLDEIDAYFHPQFQIDLVKSMIEIISNIFADYQVQIIFTSNTPLEISDFPSTNITYIDNGKMNERKEILSFGANVCNLLKNNFYIDSSMGTFAKQKIADVISFLEKGESSTMGREEAEYVISIIGEPIIKKKLQSLYDKKYMEENSEIRECKNNIEELKQRISNGEEIDTEILMKNLNAIADILNKSKERSDL